MENSKKQWVKPAFERQALKEALHGTNFGNDGNGFPSAS